MTAEVRSVVVKLTMAASEYIATAKTAGDTTEKAMLKARVATIRQGAAIDDLGNKAGKFALLAAAGFVAIEANAAKFEKSMSSIDAATNETTANMAALREEALQAGADTAFSATEAAAGIENLAKAGLETEDILGGGLSGALDLAAAGNLDVASSAEIAATALTQFNLAGEDVPHVADLLAAGAGKAQGEVADLGAALNQSGLVASQMGISIEETTGTLAAFASAGLIGSDAGTSFKTMLLSLASPSKQAAELMDQYGISAYDANGNLVSMADLAGQLQAAFQGQTQAQRDAAMATIFGTDAIRAANVLYSQGAGGITDWTGKVNDSGYAAEVAGKRMDNLLGDIEQFTGSLETALIGSGTDSQGFLRDLVQNATEAVNVFNDLPAPVQSSVTSLLGLAAVTGGGLWLGSKATRGISETRDSLDALGWSGEKSRKVLGRSAIAFAGLGLEATGLADKMGLSNTASMAMMGTIAGPWGTALGGGIGLIQDFRHESTGARDATRAWNKELADGGSDMRAYSELVDQAHASVAALADDVVPANFGDALLGSLDPDNIKMNLRALTGTLDGSALAKELDASVALKAGYDDLVLSLNSLGKEFGALEAVGDSTQDLDTLTGILVRAQPAMDALGISVEDLQQGARDGSILDMADQIQAWLVNADTAEGRADALAGSVAELGSEMMTVTESADAMSAALDGLLSPNLNLSEATDAWTTALRALDGDLAKNNKTLVGNSDAAIANRAAIRDRVTALQDMLTAEAEAGAGPLKLARTLQQQKDALIASGVAADLSGKQLRAYLRDMGLTPDLVQTIFEAVGTTEEAEKVKNLRADFEQLPKGVRTDIRTDGVPMTKADIADLRQQYKNLDAQDVETLIELQDAAARSAISNFEQLLKSLDGDEAVTYITTVRRTRVESRPGGMGGRPDELAAGGQVRGPGSRHQPLPRYLTGARP